LRGLLTLLKHTSLPKRMKLVAKALKQHIPVGDSELVFEYARNLRTSGAVLVIVMALLLGVLAYQVPERSTALAAVPNIMTSRNAMSVPVRMCRS
jgi:hypothetical protein